MTHTHNPDPEIEPITGQQLRDAREQFGWSQAQLADALGLATKSISNWERSGSIPRSRWQSIYAWLRMAAVVKVHEDESPGPALRPTYADLADPRTWMQQVQALRSQPGLPDRRKVVTALEKLRAIRRELDQIAYTLESSLYDEPPFDDEPVIAAPPSRDW